MMKVFLILILIFVLVIWFDIENFSEKYSKIDK